MADPALSVTKWQDGTASALHGYGSGVIVGGKTIGAIGAVGITV
jgi:hypothetical protein